MCSGRKKQKYNQLNLFVNNHRFLNNSRKQMIGCTAVLMFFPSITCVVFKITPRRETKGTLTWILCPSDVITHPQKEVLSMLDLMVLWFSLLDLVTKLASPFCRRLLCADFCSLVSCRRTFWRTTSCRTCNDNNVLTVCVSTRTTFRHVGKIHNLLQTATDLCEDNLAALNKTEPFFLLQWTCFQVKMCFYVFQSDGDRYFKII